MIPIAVFVLAIALQTKISLSSKFLRNLGRMSKTFTHVLSTSREHTTELLVKSFGKRCVSTVLTAACYWPSSHCIPAQKFVSVSGELNHDRSPFVLDSDKGVCCHRFLSQSTSGVAKLRPAGRIRPADQFNPTRQIPFTFFSSATFPTVDSSAAALTAACHINRTCVPGPPVAR